MGRNYSLTFENTGSLRRHAVGGNASPHSLEEALQRGSTVLGVRVKLRQVVGMGGTAVALGQRTEALESLGDDRRETLLARQVRDQEDVLRCVGLVAAMRPP